MWLNWSANTLSVSDHPQRIIVTDVFETVDGSSATDRGKEEPSTWRQKWWAIKRGNNVNKALGYKICLFLIQNSSKIHYLTSIHYLNPHFCHCLCLFLSKLSVGSNLFFFSVPGSHIWVNLLYNCGGKCKFMHWLKETWNTVAGKKYVWIIQSKLNTNHINKQSVCINTNYDTFPFKSIWIPRLMTSPKVNWILLMTWEKSSEFTFALKI